MNLAEQINTQLNNPECGTLAGMVIGKTSALQDVALLMGFIIVFKLVDKLAIEPAYRWVKNRWKKG